MEMFCTIPFSSFVPVLSNEYCNAYTEKKHEWKERKRVCEIHENIIFALFSIVSQIIV